MSIGDIPSHPVLLTENLVFQSAFLTKNSQPLSLILIGGAGTGKSRFLQPFIKHSDSVFYTNDITPHYLVKFLEKVRDDKMKFLAIPDFSSCMGHRTNTHKTLISILREMTEQGVKDLSGYGLEFESKNKRVKAGLITTITSASYQEFKNSWARTGFLSRLLPFSFQLSPDTTQRILDSIDAEEPDDLEKFKFKIRKEPFRTHTSKILLSSLHMFSGVLARQSYAAPFRAEKQLIALTKAYAVLKNEHEVTLEHVNRISYLANWLNYGFRSL